MGSLFRGSAVHYPWFLHADAAVERQLTPSLMDLGQFKRHARLCLVLRSCSEMRRKGDGQCEAFQFNKYDH